MLESRISAGMMVSSARAASKSSQDWKRAASVNSTGTPSSSIRREVGSSSRDGQQVWQKQDGGWKLLARASCACLKKSVVCDPLHSQTQTIRLN
jgi:hypothetical protein